MPVDDEGTLYRIHPATDPEHRIEPEEGHPSNQNQAQQPGPQPGTTEVEAVTAFLVAMGPDGRWIAHLDLSVITLTVQRPASLYDLIAGCPAVTADVTAQMAAQAGVQAQMQIAQQIAQQQESQRIAQNLGLGPNGMPSGPRRR